MIKKTRYKGNESRVCETMCCHEEEDTLRVKYEILIKRGKLKDKEVFFTCDLNDIEDLGLHGLLIDYGFLDEFSPMQEYYTVLSRTVFVAISEKGLNDILNNEE